MIDSPANMVRWANAAARVLGLEYDDMTMVELMDCIRVSGERVLRYDAFRSGPKDTGNVDAVTAKYDWMTDA